MYWCRCLLILLLSGNCWAAGEYVIAAGAEGDSADGLAGSLFGDVALGDRTWLSGGVARTRVDLGFRDTLRTWYADIGIDHNFDPVGIRVGAAYWGDNDLLDSLDGRLSGYVRGDWGLVGLDYEYRDFELELPPRDIFARREARFHAHGIGMSSRFNISETASVHLRGISYDYSIDLRLDTNRDIVSFLSVSRLSLINSLVDYRVSAGLGLSMGLRHLQLDIAQWKGAVAGSITNSYSIRYTTPIGQRSDIEFGLGYDDSEAYGDVTFFSVYLFFYGGT